MSRSRVILPIIVVSQFCCTSLWFAGNGVMDDLAATFLLGDQALGHITSSVQFGFIFGTLTFAVLTIADRFSPSKVFLLCALVGALFNLGLIWSENTFMSILAFRFFTGFMLAGVYPVGMKIAADHFEKGLGISLSFLVGALVLGTAFPHLLKDLTGTLPWKTVLITTSALAVFGGAIMALFVPNGPYRKAGQKLDFSAFAKVFRNGIFRSAAFGYFGHMWELYAFWAFVPVMLSTHLTLHPEMTLNIPLWSFLIIGVGGLACVLAGYLSKSVGTKQTASLSLLLSACCCLVSPMMFNVGSEVAFIGFLLFWGMVVIADSPLFSTMVAQNASPEIKGTALTIVNCIGFSITIISIQLLSWLMRITDSNSLYMILGLGPILGLIALKRKDESPGS